MLIFYGKNVSSFETSLLNSNPLSLMRSLKNTNIAYFSMALKKNVLFFGGSENPCFRRYFLNIDFILLSNPIDTD